MVYRNRRERQQILSQVMISAVITSTYPGFDYQPNELVKFIACTDIFTILLKNGEIIHYVPADKKLFYEWLVEHKIVDIKI